MPSLETVRETVSQVCDPEIPILTIADLGILRRVAIRDQDVLVVITPTYSGCPAMQTIERDILRALKRAGIANVVVETQLAPAWTTDWLSEAGRQKLRSVGIAPPLAATTSKGTLRALEEGIRCPQCGSEESECISEFGSTACKALYRCKSCLEPFDYFKCH